MNGFTFFEKKLPTFSTNTEELKQLSDEFWKERILYYLLKFASQTSSVMVQNELQIDNFTHNEKTIKKMIAKWYKMNIKFKREGFFLQREPLADNSDFEGYYDLKFGRSNWGNDDKNSPYFAFECKCLENSTSLKHYIFYENLFPVEKYPNKKTPHDGGIYRYLTGKYAYDSDLNTTINFGGMIGFLLKGNIEKTIDNICDKLQTEKYGKENYLKPEITRQSIENQSFTFDSSHQRFIAEKPNADPILLHHIIMDFTIS